MNIDDANQPIENQKFLKLTIQTHERYLNNEYSIYQQCAFILNISISTYAKWYENWCNKGT